MSISLSWAYGGLGPLVEDPGGPRNRTMSLQQKSQLFRKAVYVPGNLGAGLRMTITTLD